jgi:hypothetical protein
MLELNNVAKAPVLLNSQIRQLKLTAIDGNNMISIPVGFSQRIRCCHKPRGFSPIETDNQISSIK